MFRLRVSTMNSLALQQNRLASGWISTHRMVGLGSPFWGGLEQPLPGVAPRRSSQLTAAESNFIVMLHLHRLIAECPEGPQSRPPAAHEADGQHSMT